MKKTDLNRLAICMIGLMFLMVPVYLFSQSSEIIMPGPFTKIECIGKMNVLLELSDEEKIELVYEGIDRDKISIVNTNGNLQIKIISTLSYKDISIQAKIFYKGLDAIKASSGAYITDDMLVANMIDLSTTSGGELGLVVYSDSIVSQAASGGIITLKGEGKYHKTRVLSGATLSAAGYKCNDYDIHAAARAVVKVNVVDKLTVRAVSGAFVSYLGNPKVRNTRASSGGKIENITEAL